MSTPEADELVNLMMNSDCYHLRTGVLLRRCVNAYGDEQGKMVYDELVAGGYVLFDHLGWSYRSPGNVARMIAKYHEAYQARQDWSKAAEQNMEAALKIKTDRMRWPYFCRLMKFVDQIKVHE